MWLRDGGETAGQWRQPLPPSPSSPEQNDVKQTTTATTQPIKNNGSYTPTYLVSRGVQEGHRLASLGRVDGARVRADRLGNATRLSGGNLGLPDIVQQRRLPVVDVSHHRHDRRPRLQVVNVVLVNKVPGLLGTVLDALLDIQHVDAVLLAHQLDGLRVERRVDLHRQPLHKQPAKRERERERER